LPIEGYENLAAQPAAFISDHAVGKITAGIKKRQAGLDGQPVQPTFAPSIKRRIAIAMSAKGTPIYWSKSKARPIGFAVR
jgi:hypothetical protein